MECRAFGTGARKDRCDIDCAYFYMTKVKTRDDVERLMSEFQGDPVAHCKERDEDDCFFYYSYMVTPSGKKVTVAQIKECSYWG